MTRRLPRILLLCLLAAPPLAARAGAAVLKECPDCPEITVIPAGRMMMGSPPGEAGRFDTEGPRHLVSVPAFALARTDVTVAEYAVFVNDTGYEQQPCDWPADSFWNSPGIVQSGHQPVVCVSWTDAQAYIAWLNAKVRAGMPHPPASGPYRLPSEAEWGYAARAGRGGARWWGEGIGRNHADCNGCGSPWDNHQIAPVASFAPNPFGLYDMLGNVWQWTADCWHPTYDGAPTDGRAWTDGDCRRHVLRGGSWSNLPALVRSAARMAGGNTDRDRDYASYAGFRLARSLP